MVHPDGEPPSRAYISATGFLCVLCVSVVQFQLPNLGSDYSDGWGSLSERALDRT